MIQYTYNVNQSINVRVCGFQKVVNHQQLNGRCHFLDSGLVCHQVPQKYRSPIMVDVIGQQQWLTQHIVIEHIVAMIECTQITHF